MEVFKRHSFEDMKANLQTFLAPEEAAQEGDIIDVKEYDVPHFTEEVEVETDSEWNITLTKLTEEHPNYTDHGLGWYVDWSQEFAGKTLEEAKKYLQK